jgi:PST family polysaccharide transporter/lipopolysaccharide exporter
MHSITSNFGSVWKALGRPDYVTKTGAFRVLCIAALIWPATTRWGIEGTALVVVGVYLFPMLPLDVYLAADCVEARSAQIYREYLYPFVASSVMFGTLWYARTLVELSPLVEFLALVPAGAVIYLAVAAILERSFDWGIEGNIRMVVEGIRS